MYDIDWSKSHNGIMLCSFSKTKELMPEVTPILDELLDSGDLEFDESEYLVDVKIHMLMPNQWPCIPNWHRDFMPRDKNGKRLFAEASDSKMYAWCSGTPLTEFKRADGTNYFIEPQHWHSFTQFDLHRGTMSEKFQWRCFIRVIPKCFKHPSTINDGAIRRHTMVYLDSEKFTW